MATTSGTVSGFWEPILREVIDQGDREQPPEWPQLLRVLDFKKRFETMQEFVGLGPVTDEKAELEGVDFDDIIQGGRKEFTVSTKAKGFKYSWESVEDDQYDIVASTASSYGDVIRESQEVEAAAFWNRSINGVDTTPFTGFDGRALFHDAHTRLDGGATQDNLFTGDVSLQLLQSFRYHLRNLVTDRGMRNQGHKLNKIVIAPDATTEPLLDQILGAIGGLQPFTADVATPHELGSARAGMVKFVYSYLADTDRTIGISQKAMNQKGAPFYGIRRRPSTISWDDDEIMGSCTAVSWRTGVGFARWQGYVASAG